jgi:hypothetical protein
MKQRVALASITCLLAACEAFDPTYGAAPQIPAYGDVPVPSSVSYVTPAPPVMGNLEVAGHLEGQLHGIRLSGETTQNYGSSSEWEGGGGYLDMNVAMEGENGAGMIIVGIDGGMRHPVFTEGRWTASQANLAASSGAAGLISVSSCAGPTIGQWPYEQSAVDYEVLAEPDPEVPGSVVLVIAAAFHSDDTATATSDVSAVIRFTAPE